MHFASLLESKHFRPPSSLTRSVSRFCLWTRLSMRLARRKVLAATGAAALLVTSRIAFALDFPKRPVRWIVGFPPSGPNDLTARMMAEFLSERLHQQFAVENRPGAASNIATESLARSPPDGYTVMELATSMRSTRRSIKNSLVTALRMPKVHQYRS